MEEAWKCQLVNCDAAGQHLALLTGGGTLVTYSQLSISRNCRDYILQVQITRSANLFALRVIWTCKKVSNAKIVLEKAIKMYF